MVDITVTSGDTPLTWNNSLYTWESVPSTATWNNCIITGHVITAEYTFGVADNYNKKASYKKIFTENLNLSDKVNKHLLKVAKELLYIKDIRIQNSTSIIYDLCLRSAAGSTIDRLRSIARQAQVAGYEEGVEFLPGEYEFKDAIIGLVVTNNTATKKVGFKNIDVYVDTPDVVDRGSIQITNSGTNYDPVTGYTTVYLNKQYHFVPNVVAAVVGGNQLGDYIFDPEGFTNISFRVKIVLKSDHTTATTGTLLWEAVGY